MFGHGRNGDSQAVLAYCWYSDRPPPDALDLARSGWNRVAAPAIHEAGPPPDDCAIVIDSRHVPPSRMLMLRAASGMARARMLVAGVETSAERGALLAAGFGDTVDGGAVRSEVEQRALRLLRRRDDAALFRRAGPILLDLAARVAWMSGRQLGLHPREFALLWRLAETPGASVDRLRLLRDVCHVSHDPGTNRIAVHISRLRAKLSQVGLADLIETDAGGAYRIAPALPHQPATNALDRAATIGEQGTGWENADTKVMS